MRCSKVDKDRISRSRADGESALRYSKNSLSTQSQRHTQPDWPYWKGVRIKSGHGHDLQSPSGLSLLSRRVKSDSMNEDIGASLFEDACPSTSGTVDRSNRVSRPDTVGRKNGARSGAFGGSFGLLRCYTCQSSFTLESISQGWGRGLTRIVSRLRSVCHRDRGSSDNVNNPSASWSGVLNTSVVSGAPICSSSSSSALKSAPDPAQYGTWLGRPGLTNVIGNTLDRGYTYLWYLFILVNMPQVDICKLCSIRPTTRQ